MLRCLPHMTNCQVPEVTPEAQAKVALFDFVSRNLIESRARRSSAKSPIQRLRYSAAPDFIFKRNLVVPKFQIGQIRRQPPATYPANANEHRCAARIIQHNFRIASFDTNKVTMREADNKCN